MPEKKTTKPKTKPTPGPKPGTAARRRKAAAPRGSQPQAQEQHLPAPERSEREVEIDEELALTFLTECHAFDLALVRAGFTRAGRLPGSTYPDWERFARHIEGRFDSDCSEVLQGAVAYLLYEPNNYELRAERLERSFPWETASPHSEVVWLSELVQHIRTQLTLSINFPETPPCKTAQVMAALFFVEALAVIDPQVEKLSDSAL